jgi:UDP-glucose-4-epimerase GalE
MAAIMQRHSISAVMHFAAHSLVAESFGNPDRYFRNNFCGTLSLLDAMRRCGVDTFVFSSTGAVYGNVERAPIAEDHPRHPINPYGLSKKLIEDVLPWYGRAHGLKWVALRYFNAAGAIPEDGIGEAHADETHLVPLACMAALNQRGPVSVMGTDYPTPDGTAIRDYVHVADLADAHVRTLRYLQQGGAPGYFNLGAGHGHSVREIVHEVEVQSGITGISRDTPRRAGDPAILVADCTRATTALEWRPRQSDLETIVRTALDWHRVHGADPHRGPVAS